MVLSILLAKKNLDVRHRNKARVTLWFCKKKHEKVECPWDAYLPRKFEIYFYVSDKQFMVSFCVIQKSKYQIFELSLKANFVLQDLKDTPGWIRSQSEFHGQNTDA